jgi:aminopeptidase
MSDSRVEKLAKVLVHYSIHVKKGDWVRIEGASVAEDLIRAAYAEILKAGGNPITRIGLPGLAYEFYKHASKEQLTFIAPTADIETDRLDASLSVWAGWNSKELSGVDPKKMAASQAARKGLFERYLKRIGTGSLKWCGTLFPNNSSAQDAEMSLSEYEDFVYRAGKLDEKDPVAAWQKVSRAQARYVRFLNTLKTIRIVGPDTDLSFNVAGRKWINCDGHENFPDGEIFTGPVENSAEGTIRYTFPAIHGGREVENVRLTFKQGKVVEAKADKGEEYLQAMLDSDAGARYVGELAFGTNYSIKRFTKNTLFDEKIGGTMHIAVGASLPESGGLNKSSLHWDMVCDTRKGFTVYGDGKPIMNDGKHGRFQIAD